MNLLNQIRHTPEVTAKYHIVLVGDNLVGTSAFAERLGNDTFQDKFKGTSAPVIAQMYFEHNDQRSLANVTAFAFGFDKNILVELQKNIGKLKLLIVMFSFDSLDSLNSVAGHITDMRSAIGNVPVVVIGNKSDLANKVVDAADIATAKVNWPASTAYIAVSALTGDKVRQSIEIAIELIDNV